MSPLLKNVLLASVLAASQLVAGHSIIVKAVGDAGGSGSALGVVPTTPRDGTRRNPFQQDATRFRGEAKDTVGETVGQGTNQVESGTAEIMSLSGDSLPQVTQGGEVQMTLHQVNGDGAGPYTCMINADGTGADWKNIQVTQNVDGRRGNNRAGAMTDNPLTASIPAGQTCTGNVAGQDNVCLVRCQNQARAGPFGGVVPVQMTGAANKAAAGNNGGAANNGAANNGNANNGAGNNGAAAGNTKGTQGNGNGAAKAAKGNKNGNNAGNNNANNKRAADETEEDIIALEEIDLDAPARRAVEETEEDIIALEEIDLDAPARRAVEFNA